MYEYDIILQVWSVLESLDADYKRDEDWCNTERANTGDKANYLLQLINKHNEQKEAFLKVIIELQYNVRNNSYHDYLLIIIL